jgi:uncharacterized surface anchored protein
VGTLLAFSQVNAQSSSVRILVTDERRQPIPDAHASLLGEDDKPVRAVRANEAGEILFQNVTPGVSRFKVIAPGFQNKVLTIKIRHAHELKIKTRLSVGRIGD